MNDRSIDEFLVELGKTLDSLIALFRDVIAIGPVAMILTYRATFVDLEFSDHRGFPQVLVLPPTSHRLAGNHYKFPLVWVDDRRFGMGGRD